MKSKIKCKIRIKKNSFRSNDKNHIIRLKKEIPYVETALPEPPEPEYVYETFWNIKTVSPK